MSEEYTDFVNSVTSQQSKFTLLLQREFRYHERTR